MEIGPLTTRSVLTVKATDSLYDAAVSMMERGVGSAVILTDGKPSGIVTDRESLRAIAQRKDATTSPVGEFVTGRLTTVSPSLEILEAARLMREKAFRHLVVVDDNGGLIGVFSMRDLVVGLLEERSALAGAGTASADGAPG
ncbi:MAG TPA: CBS domain-containing protein [Acidimicrobiales bacterium]|jgi:CBS domain-containing protein